MDHADAVMANLETFAAKAMAVVTDEFLDKYNDDWRFYYMRDDDGNLIEATDPALDREQFAAALTVTGINVIGDALAEIWYDDAGMFGGHALFVTAFDGTRCSELQAGMFG